MKKLFLFFIVVFTVAVSGYSQEMSTEEFKYVIFTSDPKAEETGEGIFKNVSKSKAGPHLSNPVFFHFVSKSREIFGIANYSEFDLDKLSKIRKVTKKDQLVIKEEPGEFLNSVTLIDMDILFPQMTKDDFINTWKSFRNKTVYFIDRSEIKNHKVRLYPVRIAGINLY